MFVLNLNLIVSRREEMGWTLWFLLNIEFPSKKRVSAIYSQPYSSTLSAILSAHLVGLILMYLAMIGWSNTFLAS